MTINSSKLLALPPSKSSSLTVSKIFESPKEKLNNPNKVKIDNRLITIEKKVITIDKLLKDFLLIERNKFKTRSRNLEKKTREDRENELEKKVKKPSGIKLPKLPTPKLGLFDWIKNFISNVILGFIAVRLIDQLPQLAKLIPIINGVMDFIIDWGGKLLDGLVTFIDWGYKAVDASRTFVSNVFGESGAKAFDDFSNKFNDIINYSLIAAMLIADTGDSIIGGFGKKGQNLIGAGGVKEGGFKARGKESWQGFNLEKAKGGDFSPQSMRQTENALMKRYFQRYGRDAFVQRFGQEGLKRLPGGMQRGALQRGARSAFTGVLGKGGAKQVLKFVRPFTKRLPIIGALLDFGLSIALGESIGRAAFKAIGAGLLGAIGTAVGSVIPVAGNIIGGIAGAALGDWAGGALYDLFFENKSSKTPTQSSEKIEKYAGGGATTRGGKYISSEPERKLKVKKVTRTITPQPTSLQPGRSVSGNIKSESDPSKTLIETYYPNNTDKNEVKPYSYLKSSHQTVSKISYLGSLFGLVTKTIFGDKPSPIDYINVSAGLNSWINYILDKLTFGYANGGLVTDESTNQDLKNWLAINIQNIVNPKINQIINDLMKQLLLKPVSGGGGPSSAPSGRGGATQQTDPNAQFQGEADFVIGDSIAHGFAGRSGSGSDTSDSKVGRKPSEVLAILKSKGDSLNGKLVDLSTGIANSQNDWATVEEQLKYLQSVGARVRLLGVGKQWDSSKGGGQVNSKLQQLAGQYGAYFYGGHDASGDKELGIHGSPAGYGELKERLESTKVSDGAISPGNGRFIQGNSGASGGVHFHIGPGTQPGQVNTKYNADARKAAQQVVKHFLGKKTLYDGRRGAYYRSGSDQEIMAAQIAHSAYGSQGGIDIQVGGPNPRTNKIPFPFAVSNMAERPGGFGVTAMINGFNAFVAHGRYNEKGQLAKQLGTENAAPFSAAEGYAFHGGYVQDTRENKPFTFIKTHDGEYVIDKDSVDAFGFEFIKLINQIESKSQLKSNIDKIMNMLDYEDQRPRTTLVNVFVDEPSTNNTYIVNKETVLMSSSRKGNELDYLWDWV